MNQPVTVESVLSITEQLSTVDKVRLIERIAPQIARDLKTTHKKPRKSLRGLWSGINIPAEEIDAVRREMWKNFPRDDI
jgi:hypothetical protein